MYIVCVFLNLAIMPNVDNDDNDDLFFWFADYEFFCVWFYFVYYFQTWQFCHILITIIRIIHKSAPYKCRNDDLWCMTDPKRRPNISSNWSLSCYNRNSHDKNICVQFSELMVNVVLVIILNQLCDKLIINFFKLFHNL